MKIFVKIFAIVLAVSLVSAFVFSGCDIFRKVKGAEVTFPSKISDAKTLSFKMDVNYKKGNSETVINMDCYKQINDEGAEEYAYVYTCADSIYQSYKNIYADEKLYEVINVASFAGTYYVEDNVKIDDNANILYHVTHNIKLASAAALLLKAKKETLNGEQVYRYDVKIEETDVTVWYNKTELVKLYTKFSSKDEEADEEYTLSFSGYKYDEELSESIFARPDTYGITYVESPISFEDWMDVITGFAKKFGV